MSAEPMPETVRLIDENGILKFPADQHGTAYIRADLCVLASTHQRAIEALREAREMVEAWGAYASPFMQEKHGLADDLAKIDAALAAIKEHTP